MFENSLMHQNTILRELVSSDNPQTIAIALRMLEFVKELWIATNYHYKGREIALNTRVRLTEMKDKTTNWKRKDTLQRLIAQAEKLRSEFAEAEAAWKMPK